MNAQNKMKNALASLLVLLLVASVTMVYGQVEPSAPNVFNVTDNSTTDYPNGTSYNGSRGYIYNVTINESAITQKWVGFVGQVQGEFALQDASGNALYDWDITNIKGELYATKEGPVIAGDNYDEDNRFSGGIPNWTGITCTVGDFINMEAVILEHNTSHEDTLYGNTTFSESGFSLPTFYAGTKEVNDSATFNATASTCQGLNLMQNNAEQTTNWFEVVLTDGTSQRASAGNATLVYDLIYATILENNTAGFNGEEYDFQILLPQNGSEGTPSNIAYYFYVELV